MSDKQGSAEQRSAENNSVEQPNNPEQHQPARTSDPSGAGSQLTSKSKQRRSASRSSDSRSSGQSSRRSATRITHLFDDLDKEPVDPSATQAEKDVHSLLADERPPEQPPDKQRPPRAAGTSILVPELFTRQASPPEPGAPGIEKPPKKTGESAPDGKKPDSPGERALPSFLSSGGLPLGVQSISPDRWPLLESPQKAPGGGTPGDDGQGRYSTAGAAEEDRILPASELLTPIARESMSKQQLVAIGAQSDQPAMLAYARLFGESTDAFPWDDASVGGVPARAAQALLLEILDEDPARTWSEDELLLVEQVTDQLSLALENARLHEETRRQLKEQIALRQASAVLYSALDTESILTSLTEQICRAVDATSAYISSYNLETKESTVLTEYFSPDASPAERQSDLGKTYLEESHELLEAVQSGEHVLHHIDSTDLAETDQSHMLQYGAKTVLIIPLVVQNQLIGFTEIWESRTKRDFTPAEINLCQDISRQASVAMERANLFEQTQKALAALEISERYQKSVAQAVSVLTERGIASLSDVLRILGQAANASRAYYIETQVDPRGSYWRLIADWCADGVTSQLGNPNLRRMSTKWLAPWIERLQVDGYLSVITKSSPPETREFLQQVGTRSTLQFAVAGRHEIPGCIGFEQTDYDRVWTSDEIAALQTAASALANTTAREDLFTQVQINLAETEALYQASANLNSAANYQDILAVLRHHTILGHVNTAIISLNLFDRPWTHETRPDWLIPVAHWAAKPVAALMETEPTERYALSTWKTADWVLDPDRPTVIMDVDSDSRLDEVGRAVFHDMLSDQLDTRSLIYVPLNVSGRWVGHIIAAYRQTTGFPEQDIRRLTSLAGQAAVAIESLRLLDETRQRNEELATLNQITSAVSRTLELNEVLAEILNRVLGITEFESGLISIADPITRKLYMAVHNKLPESMVTRLQEVGLGNTPCELVYNLGRLIYVADLGDIPEDMQPWKHVFDGPRATGYESYLGVPLLSKGIKLGTVCLFNPLPKTINPSRLSLMDAIGQQIGVVVDNARLFQSTQNALSETETLYQASAELNAVQSFDEILQTLRKYSVLGEVDHTISLDLFDHPWIGATDTSTRDANMPEKVTITAYWTRRSAAPLPVARKKKTGGLRDPGELRKPGRLRSLDSEGGSASPGSPEVNYYFLRDFPALVNLLRPDTVLAIEDIHNDPRFSGADQTLLDYYRESSSAIFIPLVVGGMWIGIVQAVYANPTQWQELALRRLEVLAGQAAVAAQNLRQVQEIQARAQYEYLTREIGTQVSSTIDRDTILRNTARALSQALNASHILINLRKIDAGFLYDHTNDRFSAADDPDAVLILDKVLARKTSAIEQASEQQARESPVSQISTPITLRGEFIGMIYAFEMDGEADWTENDSALLQTVSSQVALALDNARLFQETQVALTETETLYQASAELNAVQRYDDILQTLRQYTILGQADKLLSISLFNRPWVGDAEGDIPEWSTPVAHWTTLPAEKLRWRYSIKEYHAATLLSATEIVVFEDIPNDPRLDDDVRTLYQDNFEGRSTIFVPLFVGGLWIGFINGVYALRTQFDEQEKRRLLALAGQAAVAVQNLNNFQLAEQRAKEAQRRSEELALVNSIVTSVSASLDLQQSLDIVTAEIAQALDAYTDIALLRKKPQGEGAIDQEQEVLTVVSTYSPIPGMPSTFGLDIPLEQNIAWQDMTSTRRSMLVKKPRRDPLTQTHQVKVNALMIIPIVAGSELIGTVGLKILKEGRDFSQDEVRLAETIVLQAATAIQNARLFEQTQEILAETEALYQASAQFQVTRTYGEILEALRQYTVMGQDAYSISIDLYDSAWQSNGSGGAGEAPEWVTSIARWGSLPDELTSNRYMLRAFPAMQQFLKSSEITVIGNVHDDLRLDDNLRSLYIDLYRVRSAIFAPLVASGQWIGHVNALFKEAINVSEEDIRRLTVLAGQAAVAIQNLRLLEESQRRANQLQTAAEIARDTSSTLALELLLQRSVNLLCERFGYYHVSIFLRDESAEGGAGEYAVVHESTGSAGREMKRSGHRLAIGSRSVIGQVMATGRPIVLNDVTQEEAQAIHRPNPLLPLTRAELGLPLKIADRVIGALDVQSTRANAFSEDDISVLQILTDQITVAVDNARSYELTQKAVDEIREADRLKSQFLANMSHELRTPLNSIIGFSRVILKGIDGPINELQQQDLTAIYNSGQHLLGLINDVLDLSKIEAGKMELAFENDVNLADIIKGVMSTTVGLVKDKQIELRLNIAPDLPLLRIDPMKIRQVLLNLLSNAAKFTEIGSITVEAELQRGVVEAPDDEPEVIVRVIDTGPGIMPEDQRKLFQPFSQVDGTLTRKTGGSGLGLSICHHLIRMHGGRIGLKSKVGQGSIFYFTLPVAGWPMPDYDESIQPELPDLDDTQETKSTELAPVGRDALIEPVPNAPPEFGAAVAALSDAITTGDESSPEAIAISGSTPAETLASDGVHGLVLAVDKDPQVVDLYKRYLSNHDYTVVTLTELGQVVSVARGIQPFVITLDVTMQEPKSPETGGLDGWQVLENLKSDPGTRNIPVVVCTILAEQERAFSLGASDYLLKPILEEDLAQAIHRLHESFSRHK